jgi:5'-nucleotidase (lipoprotein e(P4) family)
MLKRLPALLAALLFLALPATPFALEPANLNSAKWAVQQYATSGEYGRDLAAVALQANKYVTKRVARAQPGQKLAIVFDIDETVLTNLSEMQENDFGYVPAVWNRWLAESRAPAIVPVQAVYETAVRHNVAVFFITARHENQRASTEKNLRQVGYDTWQKAYFMADDTEKAPRLYKTAVRVQIESEGYTIIANIGDQASDLQGGHADKTFKLPNPFYIVK